MPGMLPQAQGGMAGAEAPLPMEGAKVDHFFASSALPQDGQLG